MYQRLDTTFLKHRKKSSKDSFFFSFFSISYSKGQNWGWMNELDEWDCRVLLRVIGSLHRSEKEEDSSFVHTY